jgi:hypothetical protein
MAGALPAGIRARNYTGLSGLSRVNPTRMVFESDGKLTQCVNTVAGGEDPADLPRSIG